MILRVFFKVKGEHVHCKVYVNSDGGGINFAHCGNLVMRAGEFISLTQGKFQTEFYDEEEFGPEAEALERVQ